MALGTSNLLLGLDTGTLGIQQIRICPACDQTPVFHGAGIEIVRLENPKHRRMIDGTIEYEPLEYPTLGEGILRQRSSRKEAKLLS